MSWLFTHFINSFNTLHYYLFFSYLLGLLAKIKCSISSSQPDLWDCKQLAYNWRLGNFMKPYCHKFHYFIACNDWFFIIGKNVTSVLQYLWELQVAYIFCFCIMSLYLLQWYVFELINILKFEKVLSWKCIELKM